MRIGFIDDSSTEVADPIRETVSENHAEAGQLFHRRNVPQLDGVVPAGGGQHFAVGAERHAVQPNRVPRREGGHLFARRNVPEFDRPVETCRGQRHAVWAERHASYVAGHVPPKDELLLAGRDVPQPGRAVDGPRSERLAVWTEGHGVKPVGMSVKGALSGS